jgi:hypothetical protein
VGIYIIDEISDWVNVEDGEDVPRVFLLSGVAGSGKSAISRTIADRFEPLGRLGSSFCFDRNEGDSKDRRDKFFSTVAQHLAELDPQWKSALWQVVKGKRSLRMTTSAMEQFDKFILTPAKALQTVGPILLVIDALDESGDEAAREEILDILAKRTSELPANFRIFITTRPEHDIQAKFQDKKDMIRKSTDAIDVQSTKRDIFRFIQNMLTGPVISCLERRWPKDEWCTLLTEKSDGLFQWAFTVCGFIEKPGKGGLSPEDRFERIVISTGQVKGVNNLDTLYTQVLNQAFEIDDDRVTTRFRSVVGRALAIKEPLPVSALKELCPDDEDFTDDILRYLGSVLSGVAQGDVPVRPMHTSFRDFLEDADRSGPFHIDISAHNRGLTLAALGVMKKYLRFNICELETSYRSNRDVPDLADRINNAIPIHLSYSCQFWAEHLQSVAFDSTVLTPVLDFIEYRFLYWLEVLSAKDLMRFAASAMLMVESWANVSFNVLESSSFR